MRRRLSLPALMCAAGLLLFVQVSAFAKGEAGSASKESCCRCVGDINHDGAMGGTPLIDDLVYLVTYMFHDGPCDAMCEETGIEDCMRWELEPYFPEADLNGDGRGVPSIDDLVWMTTYMVNSGPAPVGWIDQYTQACKR